MILTACISCLFLFRFFDYLQGFDEAQCFEAPDVTDCALSVMDKVDHCDYNNFAACVGDDDALESDIANEKLEAQLAWIKEKNFKPSDFPVVEIGTDKYEGSWDVAALLKAYCDLFPDDNMHPVSCDICLPCQDVRRCLWKLECDGTPFDPTTFLISHGYQSPAPTPSPSVATLPAEDIAASTASSTTLTSPHNRGAEKANNGVVLTFFVSSLVLSALIAGCFVYRNRRTRHLMAEIRAEQRASGGYHDDDSFRDFELSTTAGSQAPPNHAFLPEVM
jgi:hypothetical protein